MSRLEQEPLMARPGIPIERPDKREVPDIFDPMPTRIPVPEPVRTPQEEPVPVR